MAEAKEKMVSIFIPFIEGESEDQFVSVNDRDFLIKKGEQVEVPECVAEVIQHSNIQAQVARKKAKALQDEAKEYK